MSPRWLYWPAAAGGGTPWAPSDLTSLVAWFKADAITGLSDADPVSTWSDESASGWDATASSTDRPTYKTAIQNGLPVVRFSGSNHLALGAIDMARNVSGITAYAVAKSNFTNTTIRYWLFVRTSTNTGRAVFNYNSHRVGGRTLDADSFASATGSTTTTSWRLHGGIINYSAGTIAGYLDGVSDGTGTLASSGTSSNTASGGAFIGAADASNTSAFDGDIAEIVVTHNALSTADREKLEGYLAWKWGLEANLPPGHPYEFAAP